MMRSGKYFPGEYQTAAAAEKAADKWSAKNPEIPDYRVGDVEYVVGDPMTLEEILSLKEGTKMKILGDAYPAYPREGELSICTKEELESEDHEGQPFGLVFLGPVMIGETILQSWESAISFEFEAKDLELV